MCMDNELDKHQGKLLATFKLFSIARTSASAIKVNPFGSILQSAIRNSLRLRFRRNA